MTTARGPYRRGIERRREIVRAAVDIFGREGFRGTTLKLIAAAIGVTPTAVLKLFGSKEQLLIDVLQYWEEETADAMGHPEPGMPHLDALRALMAYHVQHRGLLELYLTVATEATSTSHPAHELMTARFRRVVTDFERTLRTAFGGEGENAISPTDACREAHFLLAIMDGLELQWLLNSEFDLVTAFNNYLDQMIARLRPNPHG